MKRKLSLVALMRDIAFLLFILRIRSREIKEGPSKAVKAISQNNYRGMQLGLKNGYYAYLVTISKEPNRLSVLDSLKKELITFDSFVLHRTYCLLFVEYLETLISGGEFKIAKEKALAEPASQIYKKILFVPRS
jgi:hypothetical protein